MVALLCIGSALAFPVANKQMKPTNDTQCNTCVSEAILALGAFEEFTEAAIFAGCVDVCQGDEGCALICTVLVEQQFQDILKNLSLDPVWLCQQLTLCPIDDCTGPVNTCAQIGSWAAQPNYGVAPQEFYFPYQFKAMKDWNGTGVVYFEVDWCGLEECDDPEQNDFTAGDWRTIIGFKAGQTYKGDFSWTCQAEEDGGNYTATVSVCEGWCDQFGPGRHPHTAIFTSQTIYFFCEDDGKKDHRQLLH